MKHYDLGEVVQFRTLPAEMKIVGMFVHPIDGKFYLVQSDFDVKTAIEHAEEVEYDERFGRCYCVPAYELHAVTDSVSCRQLTIDDVQYFFSNQDFPKNCNSTLSTIEAIREGAESIIPATLKDLDNPKKTQKSIAIIGNCLIANTMRLMARYNINTNESFIKHTKI